MTLMIFQTDSYIHSFDAVVSGVDQDNRSILLDQTAFYPGGGGQPADFGHLIAGTIKYAVKRSRKIGGDIHHYLEGADPLPGVGEHVHALIDWEHRYKLMRTHTAMHILCGVIYRDYGASVTGGDMEPLNGRMDFEFETMHKELVAEIETSINVEVVKERPVQIQLLPREEAFQIPDLIRTKINLLPEGITEIRVVEIVGLDLQADGGTHVKNTREVGQIRVVDYKSKGKINKRIYVELVE